MQDIWLKGYNYLYRAETAAIMISGLSHGFGEPYKDRKDETMRKRIWGSLKKRPNICVIGGTLLAGLCLAFFTFMPSINGYGDSADPVFLPLLVGGGVFGGFVVYPAVLTFQNLWQLCRLCYQKERVRTSRITDVITILWGFVCTGCYLMIADIRMADWTETLVNSEKHTPVATWTLPTIITVGVAAFLGYAVLRYIPLKKLPPLFCVLAMSAMYLGIGLCILFCIQLMENDFLLAVYPFNLLLVFAKTVRQVCMQQEQARRFSGLAFLLMWPLLGVLTAILILFGQKPDSLIQAWTQTSDWTLSLQKAPPNVLYDEHYLCTVAAGGHPQVVKPLRMGERRGHRIVVNRQLLVANAFEDLLAERLPRVHRQLRSFYDTYGYPIARHIRSRWTADLVYLMMKPLEYFFVAALYLFDTEPENRIAVQYLGGAFDIGRIRETGGTK